MFKHRTSILISILLTAFLLAACNPALPADSAPSPIAPTSSTLISPTEAVSVPPTPTDAAITLEDTPEAEESESALPPGVEPLPEPNPIHLNITLEENNTTEAEIGFEGGTLEVMAADGTRFTLVIPAGALLSPELIRMIPARSVEGVPFEDGALATVNLEPEGLVFYRPVALHIQPPDGTPLEEIATFGTLESGQDFHLYPSSHDENALILSLSHFSGYGLASIKSGELERVRYLYTPSQADTWAYDAAWVISETEEGEEALASYEEIGRKWLNASVLTNLKNAAVHEDRIEQALGEYLSWVDYISLIGIVDKFTVEDEKALDAIALALKNAIDKAHGRCNTDPKEALRMLRWGAMAEFFKVWGRQGFDRADTINKIESCFSFEFVFRSQIKGQGGEGGSFESQVSTKIPLSLSTDTATAIMGSMGHTGPMTFDRNVASPLPPDCKRITIAQGTMEVIFIVGLNLNYSAPQVTKVDVFFGFPEAPTEGLRCTRLGKVQESAIPIWMPAFEGMNSEWGSVKGGFKTAVPIVNRDNVLAELIIDRGISGMDATEYSIYQLVHTPGG